MKQSIKEFAPVVVGIAIVLAIIIGVSYICSIADESTWNNGYCGCGGEWKFTNGSSTSSGISRYWYTCEECGNVMYLNSPRKRSE